MQSLHLEQSSYFDITLFDDFIQNIKKMITKYRANTIEQKLNHVINDFSSLVEYTFEIKEENIYKYDNFLEYLEKLQDYLEQLEDLSLTQPIEKKLDKALDIVTLLQFRISGAMSDYHLKNKAY